MYIHVGQNTRNTVGECIKVPGAQIFFLLFKHLSWQRKQNVLKYFFWTQRQQQHLCKTGAYKTASLPLILCALMGYGKKRNKAWEHREGESNSCFHTWGGDCLGVKKKQNIQTAEFNKIVQHYPNYMQNLKKPMNVFNKTEIDLWIQSTNQQYRGEDGRGDRAEAEGLGDTGHCVSGE